MTTYVIIAENFCRVCCCAQLYAYLTMRVTLFHISQTNEMNSFIRLRICCTLTLKSTFAEAIYLSCLQTGSYPKYISAPCDNLKLTCVVNSKYCIYTLLCGLTFCVAKLYMHIKFLFCGIFSESIENKLKVHYSQMVCAPFHVKHEESYI